MFVLGRSIVAGTIRQSQCFCTVFFNLFPQKITVQNKFIDEKKKKKKTGKRKFQ